MAKLKTFPHFWAKFCPGTHAVIFTAFCFPTSRGNSPPPRRVSSRCTTGRYLSQMACSSSGWPNVSVYPKELSSWDPLGQGFCDINPSHLWKPIYGWIFQRVSTHRNILSLRISWSQTWWICWSATQRNETYSPHGACANGLKSRRNHSTTPQRNNQKTFDYAFNSALILEGVTFKPFCFAFLGFFHPPHEPFTKVHLTNFWVVRICMYIYIYIYNRYNIKDLLVTPIASLYIYIFNIISIYLH